MSDCPLCGGQIETPDLILAADMQLIVRNRQVAKLTRRQYQIFECLNQKPFHAFSRGQIMDYMYGLENDEPDWHIIMVMIHHMRKRLVHLGITIETVPRFGYMLKFSEASASPPVSVQHTSPRPKQPRRDGLRLSEKSLST